MERERDRGKKVEVIGGKEAEVMETRQKLCGDMETIKEGNYLHITRPPTTAMMENSKTATGTKMPTFVAKGSSPPFEGASSEPRPTEVL